MAMPRADQALALGADPFGWSLPGRLVGNDERHEGEVGDELVAGAGMRVRAEQSLTVSGDRRFWWVPLPRWLAGGALLGGAATLIMGLTGAGWEPALLPSIVLAAALCGLGHCLIWFGLPCRMHYTVQKGQLRAVRGRYVVATWDCADITDVVVAERTGMSWPDLLLSPWYANMGGPMPPSWVQIQERDRRDQHGGRRQLPTIMIWGPTNAQRATAQLGAAIAQQRAEQPAAQDRPTST